MFLPNDIARCINNKCPLKTNCKRYLSPTTGNIYTISNFKPKSGICENQIKINPTPQTKKID